MLIDIEKVKVTDRIRKDFGDIKELADDIKSNGLINPPVVVPENDGTFTLIAGERRLRAMKSLEYKQIEVRTWSSLNDEQKLNIEISENEVRKDFSKAERIEYARRLEKIESAKAKERQKATQFGNDTVVENFPQPIDIKTRDIIAEKLEIGSGKQYEKEKFIVDNKNILSDEDFVNWDEGKLSTNKAFMRIKEQLKEKDNKIAGYEMKLNKVKQLEDEISQLSNQLQNRPTVEIEKEVIPDDYDDLKKTNSVYQTDYKRLQADYEKKTKEIIELKSQIRDMETSANSQEIQFSKDLKNDTIFFCAKVNSFLREVGGLVWLTDHVNELPEYERKSYKKAIEAVFGWASIMNENINNNN